VRHEESVASERLRRLCVSAISCQHGRLEYAAEKAESLRRHLG
jgi:hypothetical protein